MKPMPLLGAVVVAWMAATTAVYPQTTSPAAEATTQAASAPAVALPVATMPATAPAATGEATVVATPQPATGRTPASMPASAPATMPAASPAPKALPTSLPSVKIEPIRNIRFQYKEMPLADVIREFAREGKKTILGDVSIDGSLTFFDSELYSYAEAMDMLNMFLEMHNYQLREDGRFLRLEPLTTAVASSKMLRNIDEAPEGTRPADIVTVVLPLRYIESQQAGNAIVRMISPWGQIAQMGKGKGLIVTDRLTRIQHIRNFLALLDTEKLTERSLRSFTLKKAAASDVSRIVNDLYGPRSVSARYYAGGPGEGQRIDPSESVMATFEERSNTVFVMGSAEKLALVQEMIEKLDGASSTDSHLKIFQLKSAKAEQVAKLLSESLPQIAGPQGPNQQQPRTPVARVVADPIGNRLIVSAPVDRMPGIEEAILKLDTEMGVSTGMRLFNLKFSDAQQLAPIITSTIGKRDGQSRTAIPFTVSFDARSNALIIAGGASDLELAAKLIEQLDVDRPAPAEGQPAAREIQVIHLEAGTARDVATSLVRLFGQQSGKDAGGIRVEAEPATNCIIVSAAQGDWTIIQDILKKLHANAAPISTPITRLVPVQHLKASDLASALRQVYDPRTRPSRQGTAQVPPVVIAASPNDKSLLISAVADDHKALEQLIKTMDVEGGGKTMVRTYQIGESSAAEIARSLAKLFSEQSKGASTETAPRFEADSVTNQLLVAASAGQFEQIEELIKKFKDSVTLSSQTETFNLKHAKATEIVAMLQTMLSENVGAKPRPGTTPSAVRIAAMSGANAILVQGTPDKLAIAKDLIEKFDRAEYNEDAIVRIIQVKNGQADAMVETLRGLMPKPAAGQKYEVLIQADRATNSILISAPQAQRKLLEEMIAQIDKSTELAAREMRTIKLEHAPASSLMAMLNQLYAAVPARGGRAADPAERVVISAAPNDRSLVIDAPRKKIEEIATLAASMDTKEEADKPVVRMYQFTGASAVEAARALKSLFAEQRKTARPGVTEIQPRFEGDAATNQLLVAATDTQFKDIEPLIEKYKGAVLDTQTKTYALKFAKASDVAAVLQSMLADSGQARSSRGQARVAALAGANAVVVQGPADRLNLAEELIAGLDKAESIDAVTRIVRLENAQADAVATVLRNMLPPPARGQVQEVTIQAEKLSNSILFRAPEPQRKVLEDLIAELDKSAVQAREFRVIALKQASASSLATMLNQMYSGAGAQRSQRDASDRVSVSASPSDTLLVVDAPRKTMEQIVELVGGMDVDGQAKLNVRTYQLTSLSAAETARSLGRLYASATGAKGPTAEPAPRFEADAATNQLFVAASARQFDEIEKTIEKLEKAVPAGQTKTFELKFARATELVPMLTTMLADAKSSAAGSTPARVSAMGSANSLVVQGAPDKLAMAQKLIDTFDVEKFAGQTAVHVVQLKNAECGSLAKSIMDGIAAKGAKRAPNTLPDPAELVTVTAEMNSNSLLVRGPSQECPAVLEMIKTFDAGCDISSVQVQVYALKNADATEMVKSIGKFFQDTVQQQARSKKSGTPPTFTATADARTNTLIVCTSPAYVAMVRELVKNLDETQDRPLMGMRYVTLTSADAYDVAIKLSAMYKDRKSVDKPVIEADSFSNAVTVIAKEEDLKTIEPLISQFDKVAEGSALQVRVIPMTKGVRADRVADVVRRVYGQMIDAEIKVTDKLPPKEGDSGAVNPMFPAVPGENEPLKLVATSIPTSQPVAGGATTQPMADGETTQPAARQPITVAVDRSVNALIVSGSRQDVSNIESIVEKLSGSTESAEAEFRIFVMKAADAASVARTLDDLFNPRARMQTPQVTNPQPNTGGRGGVAAVNPAAIQPLPLPVISVVADPPTKSVIVRAKAADFDIIDPLIKHLDQRATVVSEVRVFVLKNTDATEVAANLRELFQMASRSSQAQQQAVQVPNVPGAVQMPQQRRAEQIRQMMALTNAQGVSTQVDAGNVGSITANRQTNSVVVAAPAEVMELVVKLVQDIDQSAGQAGLPVVRFYPLKQAEVRPTVTALQELFVNTARRTGGTAGGAGGRAANTTSSMEQVVITGDEAGKLVIVSAAAEKHELIAKAIEQIDNAQVADQVTVQVYRLQSADAASVAVTISTALDNSGTSSAGGARGQTRGAAGSSLRVSADRSSNSLVVRASKEDHARIAEIIGKMDVAPLGEHPIKTIALTNIDATETANVLRSVFGSGQTSGRNQAAGGARPAVVIEASKEARMLLVRADDETFKKIEEMVTAMDSSPSGKAVRTVIPLKNATASTVAPALMQAFAPPKGRTGTADEVVVVVAEPTSNSIVVTANEANTKRVQEMIAKLDTDTGGLRTELLVLKNAKAVDLAAAMSKIVAAKPKQAQQPQLAVAADASTNALILSGPGGELDKMVAMAKELDQVVPETAGKVYIIPLTNGLAADVAAMIKSLYQQQQTAATKDKRALDPLAVSSDDRANAIVLSTTKDMYEQVQGWVGEIEKLKPARGRMRIITVDHADPTDVQRAIDQLYGGHGDSTIRLSAPTPRPAAGGARGVASGGAGASGGTIKSGSIETSVLPNQRALIVSASDEDYEAILKLVAALEEAASKTKRQVKVFVVKNTTNVRVATALTQTYAISGRTGTAARPEDAVAVSALPQTDAIVVSASKEKMEEIAGLIEQLDRAEVAPDLQFRIYALTNTMPTKILPTLQQMVAQIKLQRPGEAIDVRADERSRSLIVFARGNTFDQLDKIIKELDKPAQFEAAEVLVIPLKKADATHLAAVLTEMLRPGVAGAVTPEARALQEQIRLLRVRSAVADEVPELDLSKPIKVTADSTAPQGSNSLLITSTPDNLKAMRSIVELLDTVPLADGVKVRILRLKYADATGVAATLKDIFAQGKNLAGKPGTTVAGKAEPDSASGKGLVNPLNVSADARTNTLVLAGTDETLALAELICKDLDRDDGKFVTEVKLFRLKCADAVRMVPLLQSVFAEGAAAAGTEGLRTQVTRLKTILDKKEGHQSEIPKTRSALTIQADQTTNILIIAARTDVMPLIADVITTLDVPGAGSMNTVRIFPLINADASRLQTVISTLYTGPNAKFVRDEDKPTVTVDTRTNALIVSGSENTFALLDVLLKRLDEKTPVELRDIRLLALKNADAPSLAATIQKMMDARVQRLASVSAKDSEALRVIIAADARSNALIIGGSAEGFQLVKEIAEQLDGASPALSGQIQLMPLKEANAGNLAATLMNLFNQRYAAARTPDVQKQKPIILADLRTNSLMIAANQDDSVVLKSLLEKLDVKLNDPTVQLVVLPMKFNDAGIVGNTIRTLFAARLTSMTLPGQAPNPQDRVDVSSDAVSNSLILSASKENLELIKGLLEKVDIEPPAETGVVRLYPLKNSDATRVSTMLQGLVAKGLYKPGVTAAAGNAALAAREKISIAVDTRTNVLIVSASKENFAVLEEIIKKVDSSDSVNMLSDIQIFTLEYADATRVGPVLQQFYNAKRQAEVSAGDTGKSMPVVVSSDARTNSLLVAGSKESFASVKAMIEKLDAKDVIPSGNFQIYPLKHATATVLQATLQKLFDQRVVRPGQTKDPVTLVANQVANALIVSASAEDMKLAELLIQRLDVMPGEGTNLQVFPLQKADATQVANVVRNLYTGTAAGGTSNSSLSPAGITVSADDRMNAVIVIAGEGDMKRIQEVITQLDGEAVGRVTEIRVFPLSNADATELSTILTDTLTKKLVSPNPQLLKGQSLMQFITRTPEGKELVASALQEGVLITPDKRTNSLVISAPVSSMPLLENLIKAMDNGQPRAAEIRMFALKNADARQMSDVLSELFRLKAGATTNNRAVNYTLVATTQPSGDNPSASATIGNAEQYTLTVTVDVRTNSLLIGGTKQYVELCAKVIEGLDASPAMERQTQVYRLHNARASDVQTALRNFLDQERQRLVAALGNDKMGAAQRLLEREVAVVAVPSEGVLDKGNTLLISASPRYFSIVSDMIKELDEAPPQVLVQVLLAEVTLDDKTSLGVEGSFSHKYGDYTVGTGTNFGLKSDYSANGGFNVSVTGGDISFFLRALQSSGKLEVLSRPQVLAQDNQLAHINVGQRVPYIRDSRTTDTGAVLNTLDYRDVGIMLDVTPRINPEGFVKLVVKPEISSVSSSTVQLGTGLAATVFNTREASTTVTVQDGHTIVLGGLITTMDDNRDKKVPVLGDIPLLGSLFKSTTVTKVRTELLIILTPRVIQGEATRCDVITEEQKRELKLLKSLERDETKNNLFAPLETLMGPRKMATSQPYITPGSLVPDSTDCPIPAPRSNGSESK